MERVIILLFSAATLAACSATPTAQRYGGQVEQLAVQQCAESDRRVPGAPQANDFCLTLHRRYFRRATGQANGPLDEYVAPIATACGRNADCTQRLWAVARDAESVN